uniref:Uncharacterized protein n=1 Tax=mine drainage metagenome TaxID=410659 RepID=E6QUL1_9ZZZZ
MSCATLAAHGAVDPPVNGTVIQGLRLALHHDERTPRLIRLPFPGKSDSLIFNKPYSVRSSCEFM